MKNLISSVIRVVVCVFLMQGLVNEELNAQNLAFSNVHYFEHSRVDNNISAAMSFQHGFDTDSQLSKNLFNIEHIVLFILAVVYICIIYFGHSKRLKTGNDFFSLLLLLCLCI